MPLPHDALGAYRHLVYGYALRLLGDEQDAADVTQDVLIRLWRQGASLEPVRRKAWVLRVTRNACIDLFRSRKSGIGQPRSLCTEDDGAPCRHPLPDHHAEQADFRRHLELALASLDEPYRSIVILREIEGLSYLDIADALELPLNTIKVYLHRGRARLRERLREVIPEEELVP